MNSKTKEEELIQQNQNGRYEPELVAFYLNHADILFSSGRYLEAYKIIRKAQNVIDGNKDVNMSSRAKRSRPATTYQKLKVLRYKADCLDEMEDKNINATFMAYEEYLKACLQHIKEKDGTPIYAHLQSASLQYARVINRIVSSRIDIIKTIQPKPDTKMFFIRDEFDAFMNDKLPLTVLSDLAERSEYYCRESIRLARSLLDVPEIERNQYMLALLNSYSSLSAILQTRASLWVGNAKEYMEQAIAELLQADEILESMSKPQDFLLIMEVEQSELSSEQQLLCDIQAQKHRNLSEIGVLHQQLGNIEEAETFFYKSSRFIANDGFFFEQQLNLAQIESYELENAPSATKCSEIWEKIHKRFADITEHLDRLQKKSPKDLLISYKTMSLSQVNEKIRNAKAECQERFESRKKFFAKYNQIKKNEVAANDALPTRVLVTADDFNILFEHLPPKKSKLAIHVSRLYLEYLNVHSNLHDDLALGQFPENGQHYERAELCVARSLYDEELADKLRQLRITVNQIPNLTASPLARLYAKLMRIYFNRLIDRGEKLELTGPLVGAYDFLLEKATCRILVEKPTTHHLYVPVARLLLTCACVSKSMIDAVEFAKPLYEGMRKFPNVIVECTLNRVNELLQTTKQAITTFSIIDLDRPAVITSPLKMKRKRVESEDEEEINRETKNLAVEGEDFLYPEGSRRRKKVATINQSLQEIAKKKKLAKLSYEDIFSDRYDEELNKLEKTKIAGTRSRPIAVVTPPSYTIQQRPKPPPTIPQVRTQVQTSQKNDCANIPPFLAARFKQQSQSPARSFQAQPQSTIKSPTKVVTCMICSKSFPTEQAMRDHIKNCKAVISIK
jgi:tetratricopeptide (TPR) repeat protein